MSARRGRVGHWLRRLGLLALGVIVGLAAVELAARVLVPPPRSHGGRIELHRDLGFRGVPGARLSRHDERGAFEIVLGSEGFRGRELATGPGAARRVLFLGDSFLVGDGLRDEALLTARAEQGLRDAGVAAEAFNLSTLDIGTGQQLLLLARYGAGLAPDDVVLVMYPANDVVNDTIELAGRTAVSAGDPIRPYVFPENGELRREWVHPLRGPLRSRSRLFALAERGLFSFSLAGQEAPLSMAARVRNGGLPLEELEVFRRHDPGSAWEQGWRRSFTLLRAVRERCDALGARLLVLVIPSEHQVQRGAKVVAWDVATRSVAKQPLATLLDWNLPERRLARFFREEGIDAQLLLAPLRRARAAGRSVYARDGHLTGDGHGLAARPVLEWLTGGGADGLSGEASGSPVPLLPPAAAAPAVLDFRADSHASFLGDGWLDWRGAGEGGVAGWQVVDRALLVLPERGGELFLEGVVPEDVALPVVAQLERAGGASQSFQLDEPGPFRIHLKEGGAAVGPTADGYAVFVFDPARASGPLASALRVQRLGFEPPGPAGTPGSIGGGGE